MITREHLKELKPLPPNYLGFTKTIDLIDYERLKAKRILEFDKNCKELSDKAWKYAIEQYLLSINK